MLRFPRRIYPDPSADRITWPPRAVATTLGNHETIIVLSTSLAEPGNLSANWRLEENKHPTGYVVFCILIMMFSDGKNDT